MVDMPRNVLVALAGDDPQKQELLAAWDRENEARNEAQAEVDAAWFSIEHGWDIEPREYFEREAPKNGFKYALAQAVHHIWKRQRREEPGAHGVPRAECYTLASNAARALNLPPWGHEAQVIFAVLAGETLPAFPARKKDA